MAIGVALEQAFASPASLFAALAPFLIAGLVLLTVVLALALSFQRRLPARRMNDNRRMGEEGEKAAARLLKKAGYRLLSSQATAEYPMMVDGTVQTVRVRADFLVERGGRTYVAEAKAGEVSARLSLRSTRRQLLEYSFAFDVDGLLLVDVAHNRLHSVLFPAEWGARCHSA